MNLEGLLSQPNPAAGTVALVAPDQAVLAVTATAPNGRFALACAAAPAGATLYGFPGMTLAAAQVTASLAQKTALIYEAAVPASPKPGTLIYVNAASSCVREALRQNAALTPAQASARLKGRLFGAGVAKFMPGYSTEFLAHIAAPQVFSARKFSAAVAAAGGLPAWVARTKGAVPGRAPFAEPQPAQRPAAMTPAVPASAAAGGGGQSSTPPTVPASAQWASDDTTWLDVLTAEDGAFADSMQDLADASDGVAAGVSDSAVTFSISSLASWAGSTIASNLASAIGGQLFSLVSSWVFGSGTNPVATALTAISTQITTIINNQATIVALLSEVIDELGVIDQNIVSVAMNGALANIQATTQSAQELTTASGGESATQLQTLAGEILDPNSGVVYSLQLIHDTITGTGLATPLPAAALTTLTKPGGVYGANQNFLSNGNCFATAQWLFHYYSLIQTQGVQLVVQAHNYHANAAVSSPTTTFAVSPNALIAYNTTLIGGAGANGAAANLVQQRDLYRSTFWSYFHRCQGFMGQLPDDMAVGLILRVSGQIAPIFYNTDTGLLALGRLSGKLRTWVDDTTVLSANSSLIGPPWTLPAALTAWRYPLLAEFGTMFAPAVTLPRYSASRFLYLYDQGFDDDSADFPAGYVFTVLFAGDSGTWNQAWRGGPRRYNPPTFPQNPTDINGNVVGLTSIRAYEGYDYWFEGTWPAGYATNGTSTFFSSQCYNIYQPSDPSAAWSGYAWFQIKGGIVVADPVGYLPAGSYTASCTGIAITLTGNAQKNDGSTVPVSFDLTPHANIALQNNDGVLEVINPFTLSPPTDRTTFLPPGPYQSTCTNLQVTLSCQACTGGTNYVPASFDLTSCTLTGVALANTNGVLTG